MIDSKVLNFHDWILSYYEPFHDKVNNKRKIPMDLYLWNLNYANFVSDEYAIDHYLWTLLSCIETFCVTTEK